VEKKRDRTMMKKGEDVEWGGWKTINLRRFNPL